MFLYAPEASDCTHIADLPADRTALRHLFILFSGRAPQAVADGYLLGASRVWWHGDPRFEAVLVVPSHRAIWRGTKRCGTRRRHNRKPLLLLRLFGLLLLRYAARALLSLLFQEPPRNTRLSSECPLLLLCLQKLI